MGINPNPEVLAVAAKNRPIGRTPSMFIEGYWVNRQEGRFEKWLYRNGFRPAWDNFLGATETLDGIDADTFNNYYYDKEHGFKGSPVQYDWTWGSVAAFASRIKSIKRLIRN